MTAWDRLLVVTLPPVGASLVRALGRTLRTEIHGEEHVVPLWHAPAAVIYAIWHGQVLMVPLLNEQWRRTRGARPVHVMASRSRDGELLARFVRRFGFGVVRGSSTRGGASALRRLARRVRQGHDVAIAPDGPRGPRGQAQPGAVALAALTGAPLVPLAFAARPAWQLRSWDRFEIPKPRAHGALVFGPPLRVHATADREIARKDLEAALADVTERALRAVGRG
jgi:lysophospholipid acyltransferase (LPLAT)-like uncharacterized protein